MPQTYIQLFDEDTSSLSSAPYIFLDSPTSSIQSESERSASNMFLSYAQHNDTRYTNGRNHSRRGVLQNNSQMQNKSYPSKQTQTETSSAYLFLPYASSHSGDSCQQSPRTGSQELAEASKTYSHWCQSEEHFEQECKDQLEKEYHVPQFHATFVSKAICKSAEETAKSQRRNPKDSYCLYASMLNRLLSPAETGSERSPDARDDKHKTMAADIGTQQEELEFLRCALRTLILPSRRNETQQENARAVPDHIDEDGVDDTETERDSDIPKEITIPMEPAMDDDIISEPKSRSHCDSSTDRGLDGEDEVFDYRNMNDGNINPKPDELEPMMSNCIIDETEVPSLDGAPPLLLRGPGNTPTYTENTMELVYSFRAKGHFTTPYSEMMQGEIHDHRARGIEFELYFKNWDVCLRGRYSGQVQNGLPHGRGVLRFDNRDLYIGEFVNGDMHGEGTLFCRSSERLVTLRGIFYHNEYLGRHSISHLEEETRSA